MKHALRRSGRLLRVYLLPHWPKVLLLCIFLFAGIALSLVNPQILSSFIDAISRGIPPASLLNMALLYLVVVVLRQVLSIGETYIAENISLPAMNSLRADLALHCLQLDLSFHTLRTPGELIERIDGDVSALGNFFSRFLGSLVGNALLLLGTLAILFRIDWRVGCALSLFTAVLLVLIGSLRNLATPHWQAERQASAELFGFLEERLSGREDLHSNGATHFLLRGLAEHSRAVLRTFRRAVQANAVSMGSLLLLGATGTAIALALGVYFFDTRLISIGTVYLIFAYTLPLTTPIEQIVQELRDLQQTSGSVIRILELLDIGSTIRDGLGGRLPDGALSIVFEDVAFRYVEQVPVLQHISLNLHPGEVLGLLGRTGSGKSTLAKLLVRLYDPSSGNIRLGGIDLRTLPLAELHKRIGMLSQEMQILRASVRENLTLFDPEIDDTCIVAALEYLGLGPWYHLLPQGLDSRLIPGSSGMSAGEAQLFAFARIFLRDPGLVILDEASSQLDPATEHVLEQALDRLLIGRTSVIIAHRLSTVQRVNTIMVLENGHCREYGAREELARDDHSYYTRLLRRGL